MKNSRILFSSAALALGTMLALGATPSSASLVPAFVQGGQGRAMPAPADQAKTRADAIKTQLNLSDADAAKLIAPLTTYYQKQADMRTAGTTPTADDRTKMSDQLKKDLVAAGLSADTADKVVTAATARGGGRRGGGGGGGGR